MTDPELVQALTAEAAKKSDLLWVEVSDVTPRAMWHVWHQGAVLVVTGGLEQPDPGLRDGGSARLVLRSRDKGSRLLSLDATVQQVDAADPDWDELAAALHGKRLNSPDGDAAIDRWRTGSQLWRLTPTGTASESPGAMSDSSHRAEPPDTPATSRTRQPFHLGKATHVRK